MTPFGCHRAASALLVLLATALPALAAEDRLSTGLTVDQHIAQGNRLFAEGRLAEAREAYLVVLRWKPDHFGAACRASRTESELGEDASDGERRLLFEASVAHARVAVRIEPDSAEAHVALAVSLGRQALKEGAKKRLALSREIKREVDRALEIEPHHPRAFHVRAIWNRKVASLNRFERMAANAVLGGVPKGASMENAVRDLETAIEIEPVYVNHRLELGRTFMMLERHADARRELEKAVALPATSGPRDAKLQDEARGLLRKLEGKK